jgi:uncharacterized protein YaaN involved in tellurite resistance
MEETMIQLAKKLLSTPSPLEMAACELVKAQREKLEAESALDYAYSIVEYNTQRIERLKRRVTELQGEQV